MFGNALGNAAVAGIEAMNAQNEAKQQAQSAPSLLSADNPNSPVNPIAAFLSGPYANDFNDEGSLANFDPMQGPLLAATRPMDVYEAIHGPVAPIDVSVPSFQANPSAGALNQLDYDAQWMSYAQQMQQQGYAGDLASIKAAQEAYNAAASSDTTTNGGQYDPAKVQALNAALDDMIDANGWSFGPAEQTADRGPKTLETVTVTPSADELAQASSGARQSGTFVPTFDVFHGAVYSGGSVQGNNGFAVASSGAFDTSDAVAATLDWTSTAASAGGVLSGALGKQWVFNWDNPSIYDSIVVGNNGRAPAWLANPKVTVNAATDAEALRNADYVADWSKLGKLEPWLHDGGKWLGLAGVLFEGGEGIYHNDTAEIGHASVGAAVWGVSSFLLTPVGGLVVGLAWTGADMLAQHYTYNGQSGWQAVFHSLGDKTSSAWDSVWRSQERMREADPKFYQQLWAQPKL